MLYRTHMDTSLIPYLILSFLHLSLRSEGKHRAVVATKALLMPSLALFVPRTQAYSYLLLGLALATAGDVVLSKSKQYRWFLAGMGLFALSHIAYSLQLLNSFVAPLPTLLAFVILAVAAFVLIRTLGKGKGWLKYLLYALNLSAMSALCVGSGSLVCMLGALAFILSDGMIALDSLGVRTSKKISEMSLYILAQLLLVLGFTTL